MRKKQGFSLLAAMIAAVSVLGGCAAGPGIRDLLPESVPGESLFSGQDGTVWQAQDAGVYEMVCENDRYELMYRQDIGAIAVNDRLTGEPLWNGAVTESLYPGLATSTKIWKDYMQSMLAITYVSREDTRGNFVREYSAAPENTVETQRFENGLRQKVTFANSGIRLELEILLEEDGIRLRIPAESIEETGDYVLYAVELLPFFGAAAPDEEGYLFYPDGSGALSEFQKTGSKHLYATPLTLDIYGPLLQADLFSETANPTAMLPVYGIKRGDKAFLASAEEGEEYAQILVNPSINMSTIKLNRCSFSFVYREQYRVYLSNIVKNGENLSNTLYGTRLEKERLALDREVKVTFLEGEQANYSGMANAYRERLTADGRLNQAETPEDTLSLTLFMGAQKEAGLLSGYVPMTTLDEVQSIVKGYLDGGAAHMQVLLRGWTKHGYGYTPDTAVGASAVGGRKGLEALDQFAGETPETWFYLETDFSSAWKGNGRFSVGRDTIQQGNGSQVTDEMKERFFITPAKAWENFQTAWKELEKSPHLGVGFEGLGLRLYQDQKKGAAVSRADTRQVWEKILSQPGQTAVEGGNLYALSAAGMLYNIPVSTSGNEIIDREIPFFQMVVYGSIPYSGEPGNLTYDLTLTKLRWIEYGCLPHFELTQESPTLLRDTGYNDLFTCENQEWEDRVLDMYTELKTEVWPYTGGDARMVGHEEEDELVRVTYSNGTVIYINYGDTGRSVDGPEVQAMDYLVMGVDAE